jgi:hypothetical protein
MLWLDYAGKVAEQIKVSIFGFFPYMGHGKIIQTSN